MRFCLPVVYEIVKNEIDSCFFQCVSHNVIARPNRPCNVPLTSPFLCDVSDEMVLEVYQERMVIPIALANVKALHKHRKMGPVLRHAEVVREVVYSPAAGPNYGR